MYTIRQGIPASCLSWCGIQHGRAEPASPRENQGDDSWVVSTPMSSVPATLHLLVLQLTSSSPVWEGRSIRSSHPPPFGFNPGEATGAHEVRVRSTEVCWLHHHWMGISFRSAGAQSTTHHWRTEPLTASCLEHAYFTVYQHWQQHHLMRLAGLSSIVGSTAFL